MTSREQKGILLVSSTALISGFSIFINKFGVEGSDPYIFALLKNTFVAVLLFGLILGVKEFEELKKLRRKDWLLLVLIGLVGGSVPFLLFFKGLSLTTGANASFIHKTMFVYAGFLAALFLKEKIDRRTLSAAALLLLGNALFLKVLPSDFAQSSRFGDLLVFLATLLWAGENAFSKYALRTIPPKVVAFGRMAIGSGFILLFLIATGRTEPIAELTSAHFSWVILTAVLLFGYVITWYTGLRDVKVSVATSILLLGSLVTAFLTGFVGSTALLPAQLLGALLLIAGAVIVTKPHELFRA